jgi:hypothetical protein
VYLLGVALDSRTKSPQELIREKFAITPNVDSFSLSIQESVIKFILFTIIFLYCEEMELNSFYRWGKSDHSSRSLGAI